MYPIAIIAGGLGTRLGPQYAGVPKALVSVLGRPFIEYQLEMLRDHGFREVVLCVSHLGELLRDHVGDGSAWGLDVSYSLDGETRIGTAGAVKRALPLLGERFFTLFGDSYLMCDYAAVQRAFECAGTLGLMTVFENSGAYVPSNILYDGARIVAYDKAAPVPEMRHIDFGLSVFHRSAFDAVSTARPEDLSAIVDTLLARGELTAYEVATRFYEIGTPEGIADLEAFLSRKR